MSKVSFVIPCYCSERTIGDVYQEICAAMADIGMDYEIILVNDSSPDHTFSVISQLAKTDARVTAINLARNFGQHAALMAGFHYVSGDVIVCLDDDGQTPACEVGKLLSKTEEGYDVVYASYENKQHSGFRNFGSKVNGLMTEVMLGKPKELYVSSYFAAKRFVIDEVLKYEGAYPYVIGLVLRSTRNICNVPVEHRRREVGASGYTLKKLLNLWVNGFTSFSVKPLRVAGYLGISVAAIGILYAILICVRFFLFHAAPSGWSSIAVILLVLGGLILVELGLIGEYIGRVYLCLNATPQYIIKEICRKE